MGRPQNERHLERQPQPRGYGRVEREPGARDASVERHLHVRGKYGNEQRSGRPTSGTTRTGQQDCDSACQLRHPGRGNKLASVAESMRNDLAVRAGDEEM